MAREFIVTKKIGDKFDKHVKAYHLLVDIGSPKASVHFIISSYANDTVINDGRQYHLIIEDTPEIPEVPAVMEPDPNDETKEIEVKAFIPAVPAKFNYTEFIKSVVSDTAGKYIEDFITANFPE